MCAEASSIKTSEGKGVKTVACEYSLIFDNGDAGWAKVSPVAVVRFLLIC